MKTRPPYKALTAKEKKDLRVLALFTTIWCKDHHKNGSLCSECRAFLRYARQRRLRCPLDPKPSCKKCPVHCYKPDHRQRVRDIMRYSGKTLVKRGRLDLLWSLLF